MKKIILLILTVIFSLTSEAQVTWKRVRGNTTVDNNFSIIQGTGTYSTTFNIPVGKYFLFSVDITSPHEVYFTFKPVANGIKKISYTTLGKKQKLVGLLASKTGAPIRAELVISSIGKTGVTKFENFQYKEINVNFTPKLKKYSLETKIDKNSVIIIPSDLKVKAQYLTLAKRVSAKLGGITIIDDKIACVKDAPMLQNKYANSNVVVLGNMNNNRAFWPAYTRKLAVSDAFFPGGKGYEVRTAVNVLSNGKNHLIIGGSTFDGVAKGVEKFLSKVNSLTIPYLKEVELDGECAKRVANDINDWKKNFPNKTFPGTSPGYDAIRRWYHHALMYYWTGIDFYKEWTKKFFTPVLTQKAYSHHYIMEWLFMTWEVTRNCGPYTEAEKKAMEDVLLYNYIELQVGVDIIWEPYIAAPYNKFRIHSRHVTSPLWCRLMSSDYLYRNYILSGDFAKLVNFTRQETMDVAEHVATKRNRPDADFEGGDNYVELANSVFRYAFRFNKFNVFRTKNAIKWGNFQLFVNADRDSVLFGSYDCHKMPAAVLSSYYRDPQIKYYEDHGRGAKWGRGMFIDRYPCGISAYNNDLKAQLPRKDFAVHLMPYSSFDENRSAYVKNIVKKYPELKKKTPVIATILRNGWNDDFNVLGISGSNEVTKAAAGEITSLAFYKRIFLSSTWTSIYNYNSALPFEQNTLQVTRAKQSDNVVNERPRASFLEWQFNLGGRQAVTLLFKDVNGVTWRRTILSHSIDQYIVYDEVVADIPDLYDISVVWRPMGKILPSTSDTLYTQSKYRFAINLSGKGFKLKTNTAAYLKKESEKLLSLFAFHGNLAKGEKINAASLLQVKKDAKIHNLGNGRLLVSEKGKVTAEILITKDGFVEIAADRIIASNVKDVKVGNTVVKIADKLTNVAWFFPTRNCYRDKAGYRKVPVDESAKITKLCKDYLASLKVPATKETSKVANKIEKQTSYKPVWTKNIYTAPDVFNTGWAVRGTIDIGRVAVVNYIRALTPNVAMPEWMEYSIDNKNFKRIKLTNSKWQPGVWTHNYGNMERREKYFTDVNIAPVKGRYFRFSVPFRPQFQMIDRKIPYRPVKILATEPFILTSNEVVKIYPRGYNWDNTVYGAFDYKGKSLFVKKQQMAPLDIKIINYPVKNTISVCEPDGMINFYNQNGKKITSIDSVEAMRNFHKKWGKSNTRHPAGGFPTTYTVGAWDNGKGIVAGRYGQTSFFNDKQQQTGVRAAGIYNINFMLPNGVDFNGDGVDETVGLSCTYLIHYTKDGTNKTQLPGTTWPQFNNHVQHSLPVWWNISYGVWGPKFYTFKALPFDGKTTHVAGISRIYMFVYNALTKKYAWTLRFANPATAGDIRLVGNKRWLAAVASDDSVITIFEWLNPNAKPVVKHKFSLDSEIRAINISDSGRIFAACNDGIYEIVGNKVVKRIDGAFTDVKACNNNLVTAGVTGSVTFWKE